MSGGRRVAGALGALGLLLGAVVVAASAGAPRSEPGDRRPSEWLLDVVMSLLLVELALGSLLCLVLLVLRPQELLDPETVAARKRGRVVAIVVFCAVFAAAALVVKKIADGDARDAASNLVGGAVGSDGLQGVTGRYEPHFTALPVAVVVALLALAALAVWRSRAARPRPVDAALETALADALDSGIEDLVAEPDARRAVIAAYARLEQVLAAHGVPRRDAEAPDEYLHRVLSSLDLSRRSVSRLTGLFQTARFSQHTVDASMKQEAIDAFVSARDELRAARERAEAERAAALGRVDGRAHA